MDNKLTDLCKWKLALLLLVFSKSIYADPPFSGTAFLDPDILTEDDPTAYVSATYTGQGMRTVYDRRVADWVQINAYLFDVVFSHSDLVVEAQVNPEFGSSDAAEEQVVYYATAIGRIPKSLMSMLETIWIHQGDEVFGGGNNNILIHTGSFAQGYIDGGWLEEVLIHEAVHTSIDPTYTFDADWQAAQDADPEFISTYARDNPDREDLAESFVPYLAVRYKNDTISADMANTINSTIPNRIAFFDNLDLKLSPFADSSFDVPLFISQSNESQQGFVRVINHSNKDGTFTITATDDAGNIMPEVSVELIANNVLHFNSDDLELGNAGKGIETGIGSGTGDWRLNIKSTLDLEVSAYIRTSDGFLTSIHDQVSSSSMQHRVPIFNPGSNSNQVSSLRIINNGPLAANVTITGYDDAGNVGPGGTATFSLDSGKSQTISSFELENGSADFTGNIGNGSGKWQLLVSADQAIQVINILATPTGHITILPSITSDKTYSAPGL